MPPEATVLVHFYRGELARSDVWRTRLDATTNWALTTAAAVVSLSFSSPAASHVILLAGDFLVWTFLLLEARRYRYYDLWIRRVRLLEEGFLLPTLREEPLDPDVLAELADVIAHPRLLVSALDAVGLRLRRTYAPILGIMLVAWVIKIVSHPELASSMSALERNAHVGPIRGAFMITGVLSTAIAAVWIYVRSVLRPLPYGELQPRRRPRRPLGDVLRRATHH